MKHWGWWVLAGLITGCSFPNHRYDRKIHDDVPAQGVSLSNALFQAAGVEMQPGNSAKLVENGKVFDEIVDAIKQAKQSVNIELFIWRKSEPSDRVIAALKEATAHGVACNVVVDPIGSVKFTEDVKPELLAMGCDVRLFNPDINFLRVRDIQRTHRKQIIVDGQLGITGGFGLWKSWLGNGMSKDEWRDSAVVVRGPVVRQMQRAFGESWLKAGGGLLPDDNFVQATQSGDTAAAFVATGPSGHVPAAERMTQLMVGAARRRIWIANSYFIPSAAVADMLIEKAKAGVDVRVLAPGSKMDMKPVRMGQLSVYDRLLEGGVRIWEYQPAMMHAKTMLVDDHLVMVGSTNMDVLSRMDLEEGTFVLDDIRMAKELEGHLEEDFGHSLEIRWDWWKKRGLAERIGPALSPLIGRFL